MSDSWKTSLRGLDRSLHVVAAVALVAVAARVDVPVPGSPVPQSLQTLAVVLVGAWLGAALGSVAMILYALLGGLGVPVFAGGAAGWAHLGGPTAGYLVGFVLGAAVVGWWCVPQRRPGAWSVLGAALTAHALILVMGWARLAFLVGASEALSQGVTPFIWGGVVKSLVAAAVVVLLSGATISVPNESH